MKQSQLRSEQGNGGRPGGGRAPWLVMAALLIALGVAATAVAGA